MDILALSFMWKTVAALWMVLTVILILLVLVQKGRGAGLGGAFGGGAGAGGVLGTKTGDFLTWVTIVIASIFLLLAIILGIWAAKETQVPAVMPEQQTPAQPIEAEIPEPNQGEPVTPAQQVDQAAEELEETVQEVAEEVEQAGEEVTTDANNVQ